MERYSRRGSFFAVLCVMLVSCLLCLRLEVYGQPNASQSFMQRTMRGAKRIVQYGSVRVGVNLGASAPFSIPEGVTPLSYSPNFNPVISFDWDFQLHEHFFLSSGIRLEYKGMYTRSKVHDFYTHAVEKDGDAVAEVKGYFTGENITKVSSAYATIPLTVGWRFGSRYSLSFGGYVSYMFTGTFTGAAQAGYLWTEPEPGSSFSEKKLIEKADFSFSDELSRWDYGVELWGKHRLSEHFYAQCGFALGIATIFKQGFEGISMPMHNLYGALSVGYTFLGESMRKTR